MDIFSFSISPALGVISVVLVFGGLIFFHELGHFLAARMFNMGVKTFSLGFGPRILSFKGEKTVYQIAALPLGGYVSLVGESADADIPEPFTAKDSFALRPAWQRFIVIAAGSVFNLLLAWIICWGIIWTVGMVTVPPVVDKIVPGTHAEESELRAGDRILSFNGRSIMRWAQLPIHMMGNGEKEVSLKVERGGDEIREFTVKPTLLEREVDKDTKGQFWSLGIVGKPGEHKTFSFFDAMGEGLEETRYQIVTTWYTFVDLISRKLAFKNIMGPVGITKTIYDQSERGALSVFVLAAFISVNLGILNLLPVPVLDGGHLLFILVEMVIRRPVPAVVQEKAAVLGLFLLLALIVGATFNDIMRLFI